MFHLLLSNPSLGRLDVQFSLIANFSAPQSIISKKSKLENIKITLDLLVNCFPSTINPELGFCISGNDKWISLQQKRKKSITWQVTKSTNIMSTVYNEILSVGKLFAGSKKKIRNIFNFRVLSACGIALSIYGIIRRLQIPKHYCQLPFHRLSVSVCWSWGLVVMFYAYALLEVI